MAETVPPPIAPPSTDVNLTIDGLAVTVPRGTNVLEAARTLGVDISAFCYHPGLSIAACCRQCLVSIEKNPKLQPSCQSTVAEGMVVHTTDATSTLARKQMLEFTLVNHPIDCPICDKAGECTLQKLYFENDNADSRVDTPKVHKAKVVDLGPHVVLDQERCILCTRCIRVCDEVAESHQLEMSQRGDHEELGTAPGAVLDNPYSLNTVDVCPVGALTSKDFRFTMRAWELEATPSVCTGCSTGCNIELHHKNEHAWRMVPRFNPDVNQYWMCDEGRMTYHALRAERLAVATVGGLPAGWDRAIAAAGTRIREMIAAGAGVGIGIVLSAGCTNEDNFALATLARSWGATQIFMGARPDQPERADGKLRTADVNANTAGVKAIAEAFGFTLLPVAGLEDAIANGTIKALVTLGHVLPMTNESRLREIDVISVASWELGPAKLASVALPAAAWAECAGTITNQKGMVQRLHEAFPPPGQAMPGWQAWVRLGEATGVKLGWQYAREVFAAMTAQVPAFGGNAWIREARPLQLRFAGSRG